MRRALRTWVARALFGRRARRALVAARADLAALGAASAVARRAEVALGRRRSLLLRGVARALDALLAAEGEARGCLPRAVALFGEARALGLAPRVVLGVRKDGAEVRSHAWLELEGAPLLEDPETPRRYEVIARLPA